MSEQITKVKAKFRVAKVVAHESGAQTVELYPVTSKEGDNADYAKYTPSGKLEMQIGEGTRATEYFKPGKECYVTFSDEEIKEVAAPEGTNAPVES